jgi:hypothetical protein
LQSQRKNVGFVLGLVVFAFAGILGWQIAASYLANYELQSEMNDLAAQNGARIGLDALSSEDQFSSSVIEKAKEHGILLTPQQVTVQVTTTPENLAIYLAADYEARVNVLAFSFPLHFVPSSTRKLPLKPT